MSQKIDTRPIHDVLYHYTAAFDPIAVIEQAWQRDALPHPDLATNFLGVRVPPKVHPPVLNTLKGRVEGPPNPGTWHADIAEWGAALRSVNQANGTFRIVELGCGWGCWLVNTGAAARARGLAIDLIGIEGDQNHLTNAEETLKINGFNKTQFTLFHGIAAPQEGHALFPASDAEHTVWGNEAVFNPDATSLAAAMTDPKVQVLNCYPLGTLSEGKRIDLLHIDIQGAEREFVLGNFPDIKRHVARVLIGTHSRQIEGHLTAHFLAAGWHLEVERPAYAPIRKGRPSLAIDGVQMWANPALTPDLT